VKRLDRLSAILVQLQSRSVVRAADMAARFGVSVRTVYRDVRSLEEAGVPVCGDAGVGYSLVDGYRLPPLMFTPEEALAFLTAEKFIEQMTDEHNSLHFRSGMDKLRAVMRGVQRDYMAGVGESIVVCRSPYAAQTVRPGVLQTIMRSIDGRETLAVEYTRGDGVTLRREVEAVGMTFSHPNWYLAAWCHLRGEYRTFRLDRIRSIEPTGRAHTIATHTPLRVLMKDHFEGHTTMKTNTIEIRELQPIQTIALTNRGDYSGIAGAFERMAAWAGANDYWRLGPRMLGVYHSDPGTTPPEERLLSACLEERPGMTPGEGMSRLTVTGGKYLVMNAEVAMTDYAEAWQKIHSEVSARGLRFDARDHYELYLSCVDSTQGPDAPWLVEFCVPVK
jgi:predicted DNA-binding transcriptional regulator YafY